MKKLLLAGVLILEACASTTTAPNNNGASNAFRAPSVGSEYVFMSGVIDSNNKWAGPPFLPPGKYTTKVTDSGITFRGHKNVCKFGTASYYSYDADGGMSMVLDDDNQTWITLPLVSKAESKYSTSYKGSPYQGTFSYIGTDTASADGRILNTIKVKQQNNIDTSVYTIWWFSSEVGYEVQRLQLGLPQKVLDNLWSYSHH